MYSANIPDTAPWGWKEPAISGSRLERLQPPSGQGQGSPGSQGAKKDHAAPLRFSSDSPLPEPSEPAVPRATLSPWFRNIPLLSRPCAGTHWKLGLKTHVHFQRNPDVQSALWPPLSHYGPLVLGETLPPKPIPWLTQAESVTELSVQVSPDCASFITHSGQSYAQIQGGSWTEPVLSEGDKAVEHRTSGPK